MARRGTFRHSVLLTAAIKPLNDARITWQQGFFNNFVLVTIGVGFNATAEILLLQRIYRTFELA